MKTLKDFNFKNKRVLLRCDFNVPLDDQGNILDDFRIKKSIPTIEHLIKKGARVVLMSHLDRPAGRVVEKLRLSPIQTRLMEYLDVSIVKAADCVGTEIAQWTKQMQPGEVLLLENLRFHKEEENNEDDFGRELAQLGDIYINDAFGVCHRSHASIVRLPQYLPSGMGLLLEKEINSLSNLIEPKKPLVAIIGGAKVETKIKLLDKLSETADFILIGGLVKKAIVGERIQLRHPEKVIGPVDERGAGKDIGPKTVVLFKERIMKAKTIFFNGVLGMVEKEEFAWGTKEILNIVAQSRAFTVVGGGDMTGTVNKLGLIDKFNHVSTGGGAMLAFLSREKLPGLEALKK
jgi:phosphoglycerate kinase